MLTPAQLLTLKAAILAETDPAFVAARTAFATQAMADWLNVAVAPTFYLWRSEYTPEQARAAAENGVTQLDALTPSKRDSLLWYISASINMTRATAQAAINDLCGSQAILKAALLDGGKRSATRGERLFATGTGSLASPATPGWEGEIRGADIVDAYNA